MRSFDKGKFVKNTESICCTFKYTFNIAITNSTGIYSNSLILRDFYRINASITGNL